MVKYVVLEPHREYDCSHEELQYAEKDHIVNNL